MCLTSAMPQEECKNKKVSNTKRLQLTNFKAQFTKRSSLKPVEKRQAVSSYALIGKKRLSKKLHYFGDT
jgi:hypothetical protein